MISEVSPAVDAGRLKPGADGAVPGPLAVNRMHASVAADDFVKAGVHRRGRYLRATAAN